MFMIIGPKHKTKCVWLLKDSSILIHTPLLSTCGLQKCLLYSTYILTKHISHLLRFTGFTGVCCRKALRHFVSFSYHFWIQNLLKDSACVIYETDLISFSPLIIKAMYAISFSGSAFFPYCADFRLEYFLTLAEDVLVLMLLFILTAVVV